MPVFLGKYCCCIPKISKTHMYSPASASSRYWISSVYVLLSPTVRISTAYLYWSVREKKRKISFNFIRFNCEIWLCFIMNLSHELHVGRPSIIGRSQKTFFLNLYIENWIVKEYLELLHPHPLLFRAYEKKIEVKIRKFIKVKGMWSLKAYVPQPKE